MNKIGIIGIGMVGNAVKNYFEKKEVSLFLYDKKGIGSLEEVNKADIVFVCVPTPFVSGKGFDLSFVKDVCNSLKGEKIVVLKSTVIPGTTEKLQKEFPSFKFLFNPEFLSEKTAFKDMENPDRQIVGYTSFSKDVAEKVLNLLPSSPFERIIPSSEAEMVKYFNNTFNALKVTFANQMYDLCEKTGIDYNSVMEIAAKSKFIKTEDHLNIFHNDYRGFGGKCLLKDNRALIEFAEKNGMDLKLHKMAEKINEELMDLQKIDDPENFSQRT